VDEHVGKAVARVIEAACFLERAVRHDRQDQCRDACREHQRDSDSLRPQPHQIAHFDRRPARHIAEILADAL